VLIYIIFELYIVKEIEEFLNDFSFDTTPTIFDLQFQNCVRIAYRIFNIQNLSFNLYYTSICILHCILYQQK